MNSEVGSDKEELKKPFHVLHEKDFEDEDRAFFAWHEEKVMRANKEVLFLDWGP